jgi:hypothetical protein
MRHLPPQKRAGLGSYAGRRIVEPHVGDSSILRRGCSDGSADDITPNAPAPRLVSREAAAAYVCVSPNVCRFMFCGPAPIARSISHSHPLHRTASLTADALPYTRREKVAAFAARDGVPATYSFRDYAESAGRLPFIPPVSPFPSFPHIPKSHPNAAWD